MMPPAAAGLLKILRDTPIIICLLVFISSIVVGVADGSEYNANTFATATPVSAPSISKSPEYNQTPCVNSSSFSASQPSVSGSWTNDCLSVHRKSEFFARYYSFVLDSPTRLQFNLESETDTYLFLLPGDGPSEEVLAEKKFLAENDDLEPGNRNSRLSKFLDRGTYTLEATTYRPRKTGSFNLSMIRLGAARDPCHDTIPQSGGG